jgi:hypothetical protein
MMVWLDIKSQRVAGLIATGQGDRSLIAVWATGRESDGDGIGR